MKADAASGNATKISTNTDCQSQNSRKRKMSELPCNPGMQKHELFFLLLLNSTLLYLKGRNDCYIIQRYFFLQALLPFTLVLDNSKTYTAPISIVA